MAKSLHIRCKVMILAGMVALVGNSCSTTKRLEPGQYYLKNNVIEITDDARADREALSEVVRPKVNRKLLGLFPIYVWAYNVPNPVKFESRNEKRREKLEEKNKKRLARGKTPKELKPFGSWWRETVGEPPVTFDSSAMKRSVQQLQAYMLKHGWFDAEVEASVDLNAETQKAVVTYYITGNEPYAIASLNFQIPDSNLLYFTREMRARRSTLRPGDQFNIELLEKERNLLNEYFKNRGYYSFSKELIYFDVDSSMAGAQVALTLGVFPRKIPYTGNPDSLITVPYRRFKIASIQVIDRPQDRGTSIDQSDTTVVGDYIVIDQDQLNVKPRILAQNILFRPGDYYNLERVTRTYRRLSALPVVRATNVQFRPASDDSNNTLLLSTIALTPAEKQGVSLEWRGTNRGGFLGISGSLGYSNKNIFGGAEMLRFNIVGGAEAQQLLTQSQSVSSSDANVRQNFNLNTIEFGPEVTLTFPKFLLPVKAERFAKSADPKTQLTATLNYQRRPDYERTRSFGSIAYKWSESDQKKWLVSPLEISLISINRSQAFEEQLQAIGDPFLTNSFQDHFIVNSRLAYTYNTQDPSVFKKNVYFYHGELESAGSLLRGLYALSGARTNENGGYEALGIQFAHYLKTLQDLRYYRNHNDKMSTAYRLTGGLGVPLSNLNVLPFEESFFGGGANNIRAWQARTLGPGSFTDPRRSFDKIGDLLLEANVEYRFVLTELLEAALFADAGNIWTINSDPARPGANFEWDRFMSEIAIGVGTGMRLNFDFFLIRVDLGLQLKDPSLPRGERWLFEPKEEYNQFLRQYNEANPERAPIPPYSWRWNLNIGIGYPF